MQKFSLKKDIPKGIAASAADYLVAETGLSKVKIKDTMNKGAVWIRNSRGKMQRLRKATTVLREGSRIELYYDEALLAIKPPEARCIRDMQHYSVWYKPAGLVAQGTMYGDHCSLVRQAELFVGNQREVFLVHRLDREAAGIMLLAHNKKAAAKLSEIFQQNSIEKRYRIEVLGDLAAKGLEGVIDLPLDSKKALTEYRVEAYSQATNTSTADVIIRTGRLHQIRRHFELIGFPVIGDPKYGKGNKNKSGMRLEAYSLRFVCPVTRKEVTFSSPSQ